MTIRSVQQFVDSIGIPLTTDWTTLDLPRIQEFAHNTGDHHWSHIDPERAAAGPFGQPIAHGYLQLSLIGGYLSTYYPLEDAETMMNYGVDKVRFLTPVLSGSRVRGKLTVSQIDRTGDALRASIDAELEVEGSDRPSCIVQQLLFIKPAAAS